MNPEHAAPAARPGEDAGSSWQLQTKLRTRLLWLLGTMWLAASAAATLALWHETDEVLDSALAETAQRLLMLPEAALSQADSTARLALIGPHEEFVVYQVYDGLGALRLHSHQAPPAPLDPGAPDGLREASGWLVLTLSETATQRRVQVAESAAHRREVLWASSGWLLAMMLAMLPLAALGTGWVIRRAFASLEPARAQLARRPPHELQPLDGRGVPAELQPWVATVNALLERVRSLVDSERSFAANMAHELRTPLAAARAQAQRLVAQAGAANAAGEPALALLRQLDRLNHLATRLLQLARIQAGVALQRAPVDLALLATLVLDDFPEARREGRLRLMVTGRPTPVPGDIDALGIALRNLIDNALKHGGAAASVTVHVAENALGVSDDGPGVPAGEISSLTQEFHRFHGSPARLVGGAGLGLAMVDSIARQSGGRLVLRSPTGAAGGFSATLEFRAPPAPP